MSSSHPSRSGSARGARGVAALLAVGVVSVLTLAPQYLVDPARREFVRLVDAAAAAGAPWPAVTDADTLLNTVLFVPLGAAVALLLAAKRWPLALGGAFVLSATVEFAQASIPGRVPDVQDIVWNTVGAAIGIGAVTVCRAVVRAARQRGRSTRT
jgi:VanZ family protein